MYELSKKLGELKNLLSGLDQLHAYRYKYFVDSSPLGKECKYAKSTINMFEREREADKLRTLISILRSKLDEIENSI